MKPTWIIVNPTSGINDGISSIVATAYTGRINRVGTLTGETDSGVTDTVVITQKEKTEFITVTKVDYTVEAVGNTVSISGTSNSANIKVKEDTGSSIAEVTYKIAVDKVNDTSWNGDSDTGIDGDPGASKEFSFVITAIVPENKTSSARTHVIDLVNGNENISSDTITITQSAGVKNYANPIISSFSYPLIPAWGGTVKPTIAYSQTWGWNTSTTNGGTLNGSLTDPVPITTFEFKGATDEETGAVKASNKNIEISGVTQVASVTAKVTLNGKSSAVFAAQTVSQEANQIIYGDVIFTKRIPSATDIAASGGTVGKEQITWSGTGSIATQRVSFTSTSGTTISDDAGNSQLGLKPITITYSDEITATSKDTNVSVRTEAGVITITATGAGDKNATRTITIYQAANKVTYGEVSIGQATPVSLDAAGQTYTITPGLKQTVSYTSGATRTETDNRVKLSADYTVKTAKTGFSLEGDAGKVTVTANPTTAPRTGFVVSINATGEGNKTATKDITFNQQGSASYLEVAPTTLTFPAAGGTQTITITSNDSWTIS